MDRSRGLEKIRFSGEEERNEDFGSLLPSTVSVDFDSRQAIESEASELRSSSGIQALLDGDEFQSRMKFGEMIADNLTKAGWSWGWVSAIDLEGQTIWIVDAHGYGKRFIVRADEILTAFLEAERAIHQFAVSLLS